MRTVTTLRRASGDAGADGRTLAKCRLTRTLRRQIARRHDRGVARGPKPGRLARRAAPRAVTGRAPRSSKAQGDDDAFPLSSRRSSTTWRPPGPIAAGARQEETMNNGQAAIKQCQPLRALGDRGAAAQRRQQTSWRSLGSTSGPAIQAQAKAVVAPG